MSRKSQLLIFALKEIVYRIYIMIAVKGYCV